MAPSSRVQHKAKDDLSSYDSSTTKKRNSHRYKSTALAPQKKPLTPRMSPKSSKKASGKAPATKSRKHVGQSSTPTLTSTGESVSMMMTHEAHSTRFVSKLDHEALLVLKSKEFRSEKRVNPTMFIKYGLDLLLKERHLWFTLTNVFPYN